MRATGIVDGQIPANPGAGLGHAGVCPQVDLLIFDAPPQTLDEDVVAPSPLADMAAHYDTTVLPTRPRKPRDKGKVEGAVLIVERWILARLRNMQFFSIEALNAAIAELLTDLNDRPMRRIGRSRRDLFEEIERPACGFRKFPDSDYGNSRTRVSVNTGQGFQ
jgi:hypothetical protein